MVAKELREAVTDAEHSLGPTSLEVELGTLPQVGITVNNKMVVQFEKTPKALANFSPGLERQRQPWDRKA